MNIGYKLMQKVVYIFETRCTFNLYTYAFVDPHKSISVTVQSLTVQCTVYIHEEKKSKIKQGQFLAK